MARQHPGQLPLFQPPQTAARGELARDRVRVGVAKARLAIERAKHVHALTTTPAYGEPCARTGVASRVIDRSRDVRG